MADDYVQLQPNSTGNKVDCSVITVGLNAVDRQRIVLASDSNTVGFAAVINGTPSTEYGLVVRQAGTVTITVGTIAAGLNAGANQIGSVTATLSGTSTVTFGQAVIASGTITANLGSAIPTGANLLGTVTANIGNTPTVTFGTATVQGTVTANIIGTVTIGSTVTANIGNSIPAGTNDIGYVHIRGSLSQDCLQASDKSLITTAQGYQVEGGATAGNPLLIAGSNGGLVKTFVTDASGAIVSTLTAGAKQIGSVTATISGTPTVTFGTATVAGTVTASLATNIIGGASVITADYDTGAGTQSMVMFGIALPASGGSVSGGTSTNPLRIDPTGTTTQPVSGTITANLGNSLQAGTAQIGSVTAIISGTPTVTIGSIVVASGTITANHGNALQAGTAQIGSVTATISGTPTVTFGTATVTFGSAVIASGTVTANIGNTPTTSNAPTQTSVTGATSDTQLLASNASRRGLWLWNDASVNMYVAFGASAATTGGVFNVKIAPQGYYEMPNPISTVTARAIWDTGVSGQVRVTEVT